MSHRLLPRSGRGCFSAVVLVPLLAVGGLAALVLVFGLPEPPSRTGIGAAAVPVTRQTPPSPRTSPPPSSTTAPSTQPPPSATPEWPASLVRPQPERRELQPGVVPPAVGADPGTAAPAAPAPAPAAPTTGVPPRSSVLVPPLTPTSPAEPSARTATPVRPTPWPSPSDDPTPAPTTPPVTGTPTTAPGGGAPTTTPETVASSG